ncbi:uncharacterized protein LOC111946309 [Oryzias latipes]|uniref:uncharacterized protein LOC111946309 n=1 Tax=Oryzias latipes TaxID=8090 RepID=UPI000CE21C27|nr:uncharacterized protein LOC111946309 [Oryzias latipes]
MVNLTLVLALLCTLSLISLSTPEFHTVKVQPEGEVTLKCSNFSNFISYIVWFKLNDGRNATIISSMITSESNVSMKDGFKERFFMTSNITHVFLNIKNVNLSDSGLYFCGHRGSTSAVIFGATYLLVYEMSRSPDLQTVIVGSIIAFLLMVIIMLFMKIRSYPKASVERQLKESLDSDALNYAAVSFQWKAKTRINAAYTKVVYATTK